MYIDLHSTVRCVAMTRFPFFFFILIFICEMLTLCSGEGCEASEAMGKKEKDDERGKARVPVRFFYFFLFIVWVERKGSNGVFASLHQTLPNPDLFALKKIQFDLEAACHCPSSLTVPALASSRVSYLHPHPPSSSPFKKILQKYTKKSPSTLRDTSFILSLILLE